MRPSVSVVVPNYNGGELFRDCVRSLAALEYDGPLDVHVVDDGSTDGSGDWLWSEPLPPFVHRHVQPANAGRAAARNVGIAAATGELIVFLDGDLTVEPDFVEGHVAAHAEPNVHAVVGRVTAAPGVPRNAVVRYLHEYPGRGARQFEGRPVPPQFVVTNNLSLRRDLLDEIGGLDDCFDGYGGEDTLLGLRVEQRRPEGIRFARGPVAYDYDVHEIDTLVRKFEHYGRVNLARLVDACPEAADGLHVDWVTGPASRQWLGRLLFNAPVNAVVRVMTGALPYPLSNYGIRYLLGSAVVRGYRSFVESGTTAPAQAAARSEGDDSSSAPAAAA